MKIVTQENPIITRFSRKKFELVRSPNRLTPEQGRHPERPGERISESTSHLEYVTVNWCKGAPHYDDEGPGAKLLVLRFLGDPRKKTGDGYTCTTVTRDFNPTPFQIMSDPGPNRYTHVQALLLRNPFNRPS